MMADDRPARDEGTLEYRSGAADYASLRKAQLVGGIVISVLLGAGVVYVGIIATLGRHASSAPLFIIVGGAALLINVWAFFAYRNPKKRALGIGLWIGFGLIGLIEGACFGLMR
jgi:FtsH-binding integral membrane protein